MKKLLSILAALMFLYIFPQKLDNINSGEMLTYRIHYGLLTAGNATLTTQKTTYRGQPHMYVKGVGRTTGAVRAVFRVEDLYESYISYNTGLPSFYVRNVKEGGYSQHLQTTFNHANQTLVLTDKKTPANGSRTIKSVAGVQDMLSAFYHLRTLDPSELRVGTVKNMNIWIDDEMFPFQIRVTGTEYINTKYGRINCLKIIPLVKSGRVFKAKEGVTLWVSNDANHIPISIKAELAVGSLKADLDGYRNVKFPMRFIK
ncbi:DUF3108 domain-containing protein [Kaistella sp. PBT33-4]|uniref:DUF3108 domain-containing protein n=1 Tax=Kaistella sp. PBT33-4 TaxID=3032000 RepID=UPI0023D851E8|nr:DUF3108 domain-containing protein [Kaistella sp. PBT33-4]MDF0720086.1 DUF3108 domain-containing protein [Kaistella sp. PBT33-4]